MVTHARRVHIQGQRGSRELQERNSVGNQGPHVRIVTATYCHYKRESVSVKWDWCPPPLGNRTLLA